MQTLMDSENAELEAALANESDEDGEEDGEDEEDEEDEETTTIDKTEMLAQRLEEDKDMLEKLDQEKLDLLGQRANQEARSAHRKERRRTLMGEISKITARKDEQEAHVRRELHVHSQRHAHDVKAKAAAEQSMAKLQAARQAVDTKLAVAVEERQSLVDEIASLELRQQEQKKMRKKVPKASETRHLKALRRDLLTASTHCADLEVRLWHDA